MNPFHERSLEDLLHYLHAPDPHVRANAALALGQRRHPSAATPLLSCLHDPEPRVRCEVISALGYLRETRAVDALIRLNRE